VRGRVRAAGISVAWRVPALPPGAGACGKAADRQAGTGEEIPGEVRQDQSKERGDKMKVKIGKKVYDPNDQPIMIILTKKDKENIANMDPTATRYCSYPDTMDPEKIKKWMDTPSA
jgi:hypothetical protein